jgi:spore coat polysaccharide biosynthesis predicted glycosyltransferase SpsG
VFLGVTTTITVAANQIQMTKDAEKFGAIWYLGHKDELSKDRLIKTIKNITSDIVEIKKKQNRSYSLMSNNSAENIINSILEHNNGT